MRGGEEKRNFRMQSSSSSQRSLQRRSPGPGQGPGPGPDVAPPPPTRSMSPGNIPPRSSGASSRSAGGSSRRNVSPHLYLMYLQAKPPLPILNTAGLLHSTIDFTKYKIPYLRTISVSSPLVLI